MALVAILDIDGTLVDTNYQHAIAWYRAFREHDVTLPIWRVHRAIGMGGDQLVGALAGDDFEDQHGDDVRASEKDLYRELIDEVAPLPGAIDLVHRLDELGHSVVLASSAKEDEVEHYLDLLGVRDVADAWTSSQDVEQTKPAPDLVQSALEKSEQRDDGAVMLGDSVYDCQAAARADVPSLGVLTGGFSREELEEAGAKAVYESPAEILDGLEDTPFA
ncbi:MAG: HAD family hydrolase [Thermoleophilaceae bacterium]|nr:HAD family hydrolase [Thermoleophilaceae bacterium]